jgi:hypothetical protein
MASQSKELGRSPSAGMAISVAMTGVSATKAAAFDAPNSVIERPKRARETAAVTTP